MVNLAASLVLAVALAGFSASTASAGQTAFSYHSPQELNTRLEELARQDKTSARINNLGTTPGGIDIRMLQLGPEDGELPAVLVVANMEGNCPIASEAAFRLATLLLGDWKEELASHRWYIVPVGNPDGYANFFTKPLHESFVNARPFNDDNDDAVDEDGPEDLNGDGYITVMRQAHPEGVWMAVESNPILMKKAEAAKGERGEYRLFVEGIDNDGDGVINEDAPGGANPGHNFPHNFTHYTKTDGPWSASEAESRALMSFAFDHPEIAMVLVLGHTNTLRTVPESSRKAEAAQDSYKIPEHMARHMGVEPESEFTMEELLAMAREAFGIEDVTEDMVLQFLGAGAAVNPDRNDLPYWNEISTRYKDFIKEAGLDAERLASQGFPSGSLDEWAYYQYGVPCFSMDFWTLPEAKKEEGVEDTALTPEKVEKMSNEEFLELGEEKISAFLKASGAPAHFSPDMVINALQGGMLTTKKIAEFMREAKKKEESGGLDETEQALYDYNPDAFVAWQPYDHPTLGSVQIGGIKPYAALTPPPDSVEALLEKQLPFVRELAGLLPEVSIEKINVEKESADVWRVEAWVANTGFLPYPVHQGQRCLRPTPVVVTLSGESMTLLEGRSRRVLGLLEGAGGVERVSWVFSAKEGRSITLEARSFSAGDDEKTIVLKGGSQ
ncbi:MAG TPA: M14 family zinc carboxypeptidase [Acidobacteriota bacterium]|nr:M14 family zinc carboxypeptidase [Acidobacteriota bacterium]